MKVSLLLELNILDEIETLLLSATNVFQDNDYEQAYGEVNLLYALYYIK